MRLEESDQHSGPKPPKEIRTVRRDGDTVTEEYERLNPDGTVTKVITVGDKKDGLKHYTVYKMDRSGIVRKIDNPDESVLPEVLEKENWIQEMKKRTLESRQREENYKENFRNTSGSAIYNSQNESGRHEIIDSVENDKNGKHDLYYELRNIDKPIELTTKQQALLREHKENIMNYGTQKLLKLLNQRLNEDKFNKSFPLSDEQKDKVIEYGVRKLHKLLERNLDDERLIYDVMAQNPNFGHVDLSGRGNKQFPGDRSITFALSPDDEARKITQEDSSKPISFAMRPEPNSKLCTEEESTNGEGKINSLYNALWKTITNVVKSRENPQNINKEEEVSGNNELVGLRKRNPNDLNETANKEIDKMVSLLDISDAEQHDDFKKMKKEVNRIMKENELYKKSPLDDKQKEHIINFALKNLRDFFEKTIKVNENAMDKKEVSRRLQGIPHKKFRIRDFFNEDEIYEHGRKKLKKMIKAHEQERLMNGGKPRPKLDVEDYFDYDEIYTFGKRALRKEIKKNMREDNEYDEYTNKRLESEDVRDTQEKWNRYLERGIKESEQESRREARKEEKLREEEQKSKEEDKWNLQSIISSLFGKKEIENSPELVEQPKKSEEQNLDIGSRIFNLLKNKIEDIKTENEAPQEGEKVLKPKPKFYRLESEYSPRVDQTENEENLNTFDLRSILKNIHRSSAQKSPERKIQGTESSNRKTIQYEGNSEINTNMNSSSEQKEQKSQDSDAILSRIKNNLGVSSNTRRSESKPYLKERISGLNNIPRPKVISASPFEHTKMQENEPISFQIKPQEYKNSDNNQETSQSHEKSNTNGNFHPWWFDSSDATDADDFIKKPLIKGGFIDPPFMKTSFKSGGSFFPSSAKNILQ